MVKSLGVVIVLSIIIREHFNHITARENSSLGLIFRYLKDLKFTIYSCCRAVQDTYWSSGPESSGFRIKVTTSTDYSTYSKSLHQLLGPRLGYTRTYRSVTASELEIQFVLQPLHLRCQLIKMVYDFKAHELTAYLTVRNY